MPMFGLNPDSVERFFINCLLVVGGFAAGYLVVGIFAWVFDRKATGGKSPEALHRLARWIGGVIAGVLVALYLFQGGTGTGGTGKEGGTSPAGTGTGNAPDTSPAPKPPPTIKPLPEIQTHEVIRVTILGGFHEDGKYYIAAEEGGRTMDFPAIKTHLASRKRAATKPVLVELILDPINQTTRDNRQVVKPLLDYAAQERMTVSFPGDGS